MDLILLNHGPVPPKTGRVEGRMRVKSVDVLPLTWCGSLKRGRRLQCRHVAEVQNYKVGCQLFAHNFEGSGNPVVKVSDHGSHVMSSSPVPLKTRSVGARCTLNLSDLKRSPIGVVVRRRGASFVT
ncbi:hypothetical protein TNCV_1749011 [Trichonephila clavipes]|nr:hypothetical protein TNCV_1749011 [Trichonephila clavipes]